RIVHVEQPGRALRAQPVRLARGRGRGQDLGGLADDWLVRAQLDDLVDRAVSARIPHRRPAHGDARAHDGRVAQLHGLAGHDLGAIHYGVDLEAEARLDDPIELLALVAHYGIRGERGEAATDREQRGHAR